MTVSSVSNRSWANFFQATGKYVAIGGAVLSTSCMVLDQSYTLPCALTALGACTWFSVWLNKSAQQEILNPTIQESSMFGIFHHKIDELVDAMGAKLKQRAKGLADKLVDSSIATGKAASLNTMPRSLATAGGLSLDSTSGSMKSLLNKSVGFSVEHSTGLVKRSIAKTFNTDSEENKQ